MKIWTQIQKFLQRTSDATAYYLQVPHPVQSKSDEGFLRYKVMGCPKSMGLFTQVLK